MVIYSRLSYKLNTASRTALKYNAFISYHSTDALAVGAVAVRLRDGEHFSIWFDKWEIAGGDDLLESMKTGIDNAACVVLFIGPGDMGPWQEQEGEKAIRDRLRRGRNLRIIPVLLPGAKQDSSNPLQDFLGGLKWVQFNHSLDEVEPWALLVAGIRGTAPVLGSQTIEAEPYQGLEMFDVEDQAWFFGRAQLTQKLIAEVARRCGPDHPSRFLPIVGSSGSGKSSLARAGLIASLKNGALPDSEKWNYAICRPGDNPLASLAAALAAADTELVPLQQSFTQSNDAVRMIADRRAAGGRRLVLLVDQFEETFTLTRDAAVRRSFIANLWQAARAANGPALIVVTLRADFLGACSDHEELREALSELVLVGSMSEEELRSAILDPAYKAGAEFEPGVVDLLLRDVQGQAGGLPLLEFALKKLWTNRDGRKLTVNAYRAIGGVTGALQQQAESIFSQLSDDERQACHTLFLRLTESDNAAGVIARRRIDWAEVASGHEREVALRMVRNRLLAAEGTSLQVAHEALLTAWDRARGWARRDEWWTRVAVDLAEDARRWRENKTDPSYLLPPARLAHVLDLIKQYPEILNAQEREYLLESALASGAPVAAWAPKLIDVDQLRLYAIHRLDSRDPAERRRGLELLDAIADLSGILKVTQQDSDINVWGRACEILVERGRLPRLLELQGRRRVEALAYARNLPDQLEPVNRLLHGRLTWRVKLETSRQMVAQRLTIFATVLSCSYLGATVVFQLGSALTFRVLRTLGLPDLPWSFDLFSTSLTLTFGHYIVEQAARNRRSVRWRDCLGIAVWAVLIESFYFLIPNFLEAVGRALLHPSWDRFLWPLQTLATPASEVLFLFTLALTMLDSERKRSTSAWIVRNALRSALVWTAVEAVSPILRNVGAPDPSHVIRGFFSTVMILAGALYGYRIGVRLAERPASPIPLTDPTQPQPARA